MSDDTDARELLAAWRATLTSPVTVDHYSRGMDFWLGWKREGAARGLADLVRWFAWTPDFDDAFGRYLLPDLLALGDAGVARGTVARSRVALANLAGFLHTSRAHELTPERWIPWSDHYDAPDRGVPPWAAVTTAQLDALLAAADPRTRLVLVLLAEQRLAAAAIVELEYPAAELLEPVGPRLKPALAAWIVLRTQVHGPLILDERISERLRRRPQRRRLTVSALDPRTIERIVSRAGGWAGMPWLTPRDLLRYPIVEG